MSSENQQKRTYGYMPEQWKRFQKFAWLTLLSFGFTYLFFCNGRFGSYFGYKKLMCLGVISSAVLNVIISFQQSLGVIAVLWGLNGFCQAMV